MSHSHKWEFLNNQTKNTPKFQTLDTICWIIIFYRFMTLVPAKYYSRIDLYKKLAYLNLLVGILIKIWFHYIFSFYTFNFTNFQDNLLVFKLRDNGIQTLPHTPFKPPVNALKYTCELQPFQHT